MNKTTREIKDIALEIGFDVVGICSPDPLEEERANLMEWLNRGYAGEMSYLKKDAERKIDARKILPGAKSVIVLGSSYYPGPHGAEGRAGLGRVAKYAAGRDYHKVLERKLSRLCVEIEKMIGRPFQAKMYVDTGSLMERPFARRAGIGFRGKHTLTIARNFGSWIFLSELITDLELDFDKPDLRDCGTCSKCIEACPTQAIVEDYVLDASRCISYLTIENRGPIDSTLRSQIGGWVFGCDICQDICPLNHHAKDLHAEKELPLEKDLWLDLGEVLRMRTDAEFQEKFQGRPLRRSKREGLLRNAAVAAGNSGCEDLVPVLRDALSEDSSEMVREHAAWALEKIELKSQNQKATEIA